MMPSFRPPFPAEICQHTQLTQNPLEAEQALLSIKFAGIESKGTFCYLENGTKQWVEDYFNLYDRVVFAGEQFSDGTVSERNRVYFNEWYRKSLNSLYIKPLDFPYWNSLRSDIARRLYEYLSLVSFATKCKPFQIEYHKLCETLPITPQQYLSKAKYCLKGAHQALMATQFLKKVTWRKSKTDKNKWILTYYFGRRATSELKRGFADEAYRPALLAVETVEIEEQIESESGGGTDAAAKPKRTEEQISQIAQQLCERGMTQSVAIDLASFFPEDYIQAKIRLHDDMKAAGQLTENAAGWLRGAIEEDYQLAPEQQRRVQVTAKRQQRHEKTRALKQRAEEIQAQRIEEALEHFPTLEEWIERNISKLKYVRELMLEQLGANPLTEQEIEQARQLAIKTYPETESDRRAAIRRNPENYNTDIESIVEESKAESRKTDPTA